MGSPDAELSVLITDDREIADLNARYLNRTGPTNVIAFPMRAGDHADIQPDILGDVVISVETARREAAAAGISEDERFDALLVHGVLHLFGYDHETDPDEALEMERKSDELMKLIQGD